MIIHSGQLDPAYVIFNVFQQRNRERMEYALKLLDTEPDLSRDESFTFDREHVPWPSTLAQMNELWRLRVENDVLSLMLTGKNWADTSDLLRKRYQRVLTRLDKVSPEDVFETLMNSYCAVFDPHTNYFSPRSSEEYRIQMESERYEGHWRLTAAHRRLCDDHQHSLPRPRPRPTARSNRMIASPRWAKATMGPSPTSSAGGWTTWCNSSAARWPQWCGCRSCPLAPRTPGPPSACIEGSTRNSITLDTQAPKKEVRQIQRDGRTYKIGIITVPSFYNDMEAAGTGSNRSTTHDVRRLVQELADGGGVDALVLDLRGDGGGFLPEAIGLTHLFINHGPVVQLKDTTGQLGSAG